MNIPKYKSFDDPELFRVEQVIPWVIPDEHKKHAYQALREELGRNLIDILERFHSPCVVELFDLEIQHESYSFMNRADRIRLSMKVRPVRIQNLDQDYWMVRETFLMPPREPMKFLQRIKWAFTGKVK